MTSEANTQQVVFTNDARCRDCYRCVRVCPVKAIKVEKDQACVDPERCIACGTCIRECPQGAKTYRRDLDKAEAILKGGTLVAASIAPSFAGVFEAWECARLPAALRRLGFKHVAETAVGAYLVARDTTPMIKAASKPVICTACPSVVHYIEKYDPARAGYLLPLVSPMMAHARHIKKLKGLDTKVIFIGPCAAKKAEAERRELKGLVDCVLTFEELEELFRLRGIDLKSCEESSFDEEPCGKARLFPIEGGALATSDMATDVIDEKLIFVSGFEEVKEVLRAVDGNDKPRVIEPLLCPHGCVNGPGIKKEGNAFDRRARLIKYAVFHPSLSTAEPSVLDLSTYFSVKPVNAMIEGVEEKIRQVLEKTGKSRLEHQLNCGACGYSSCREQALAVIRGMAEAEMCIPYMRRLAEQRSDRIMETSPNGIVVLDHELKILNFNPAFGKMFKASPSAAGRHISQFMDPDPFEKVASGECALYDDVRSHTAYGLVAREVVYALQTERQYVGMFINMTAQGVAFEQLQHVKDETIQQARELHAHQIEMAKQLASFLGSYTAKGEQLVQKLVEAVKDKKIDENRGG
ncbi:MAG: 4Fe-4S binding protein [Candidatus Omnitrophica bacterium]|nr:4Fe-4S binding protein [Candidatus Omnitrophota bacterium]